MSNESVEKKASPAVAPEATAAPVARSKPKVVIMGYGHADQELIKIFPQLFAKPLKEKISIGLEISFEEKKLETYCKAWREDSIIKTQNNYEKLGFTNYRQLSDFLNMSLKDVASYIATCEFQYNHERDLDARGQRKYFNNLVYAYQNAHVNFSLFESILKNEHDYFYFDASKGEIKAAGDALMSGDRTLSHKREASMAERIAVATATQNVFVVIGAAHVESVTELLRAKGIEVEHVGIKLVKGSKEPEGTYSSSLRASVFLPATVAPMPTGTAANLARSGMGGTIGSAANSVTGQSTWWNTLMLKHMKKQKAKNSTDKNKVKLEIANQVIPNLVFDQAAIGSADLTCAKALEVIKIYEDSVAITLGFQTLKSQLTAAAAMANIISSPNAL